jgi:hypothetical protein
MGHKNSGGPCQFAYPCLLLIVVFITQGLVTADLIVVIASNGVITASTTAAEDDSIKADKGG